MMPVEATGILGAIAGIAELTKDSGSRTVSNAVPRVTPPQGDR